MTNVIPLLSATVLPAHPGSLRPAAALPATALAAPRRGLPDRRAGPATLAVRGLLVVLAAGWLLAAVTALAGERLRVGVMAGVEEEIGEVARGVAARAGLELQLVTFSDYLQPNAALDAGDLDANAFQHQPYLDAQIRDHGYKIVRLADTIVSPIRLYSRRVHALDQLRTGAVIGIPNDPSNGGRALNLLAAHGLITLAPGRELLPSVLDVSANPRRLKFTELDAALLPRALPDLDAAVINTDHALNGGLDPERDSLISESREHNPYRNFVAVRAADRDRAVFRKLAAAYQSKEVADFLRERFHGAILPAW